MKIKIWCPDNESEEDAEEFEVDDPCGTDADAMWSFWFNVEWAVKDFAEKDHPHSDHWEKATFHARVGAELKIYEVAVEMEPTFCIAEVKPKRPA